MPAGLRLMLERARSFVRIFRNADYALICLHLESPGVLKQFDMICAEARKRAKYESNRT